MTNPSESVDFQQALNNSAHFLRQNRPSEAVQLLEPLHEEQPTHPDVAINLGGAYILQRKWNKAVKILGKAAVANPENAMLWTNLAAAELGNLQTAGPRQQERAIRAYERALQVDPTVPNVHYHLGLIYKERGELMRASAFFQRALEVNPNDKDARHWIDRLQQLSIQEQRAREQQLQNADGTDDGAAPNSVGDEQIDDDLHHDGPHRDGNGGNTNGATQ
ncbi:MAG: tetratricopeptide repeat protein [Caldilineaceae bacterium]|nr:tetratricopeptide repeat protein [Caldilineaceae bacterium]